MSKYGSQITISGGKTFHSKKEASRFNELDLLYRAGKIKKLVLQPSFELQGAFKVEVLCPDGSTKKKGIRAITYIADFQYEEDGRTVVEDVKGFLTEVYKLKKKLFLKKYPNLLFRET